MNKIQAKQINSFGKNVLSIFIDDTPLSEIIGTKSNDTRYKDLWCAWLLKKNNEPWEQHGNYVWTLLETKQNCNLPILLCPDDMDFWCSVVVAQASYYNDIVVWGKIGIVTGQINKDQWNASGIKDLKKWSEQDWELYGSSLATLKEDNEDWERWCSEHWLDEENRRLWNYFHPYLNDDKNIEWLDGNSLSFYANDYDDCVAAFKGFVY